jgi:hypothetical protein
MPRSALHGFTGHEVATQVIYRGGGAVIYHGTKVFSFNPETGAVTLDTGGWFTATTKRRMNQAAAAFGLDFYVFQRKWSWFVATGEHDLDFDHRSGTITFVPPSAGYSIDK